jgi:hypothetical protein
MVVGIPLDTNNDRISKLLREKPKRIRTSVRRHSRYGRSERHFKSGLNYRKWRSRFLYLVKQKGDHEGRPYGNPRKGRGELQPYLYKKAGENADLMSLFSIRH